MADAPVLNQLVEEATNRAFALADEAQEASGIVDELLERAGSLGETLTEEAEEMHHGFQELHARLEAADDELEDRVMRARASLEALPARTASVQGRVDELLATVKGQLAELEAREDELSATLDRLSEAARADLEQLAEQTRKLQAAAEVHLEEATRELEILHAGVAQAREDIQTGKGELLEAMDALENTAREQVQRFVEGMGTTLTAHTTALFELEHRLKDAHNDAVVALRKKFAEEVVSRLPAAAASLKESLETLGAFCGEEELTLIDECSRALDGFERAIQSARRSQGLLQAADRLL
jgi:chromosome segregation ATPase